MPDSWEMVPAEGFVLKVTAGQCYLVPPLVLLHSKTMLSFSTFTLNSHCTLC